MKEALWTDCAGIKNDGRHAHSLRDHCTTCAPFWERVPQCPHCHKKLFKMGKTKCRSCGKFVRVTAERAPKILTREEMLKQLCERVNERREAMDGAYRAFRADGSATLWLAFFETAMRFQEAKSELSELKEVIREAERAARPSEKPACRDCGAVMPSPAPGWGSVETTEWTTQGSLVECIAYSCPGCLQKRTDACWAKVAK
jgi:hypothetical protein